MQTTNQPVFERNTFKKRISTMLKVDFRRMFTSPFVYIMLGISLVMPILILVMTTMMDGTVSVNPQTGVETVIEGFDNVWQVIGTLSSANATGQMNMDMTAMCNINLIFFISSVLVCVFIADDFRSGYAKNLFTVRAKKGDYVISKSLVCFVGSALMIILFFVGAMLGGAIAGLPFDITGTSVGGIICCLLCKVLLVSVFTSLFTLMSVVGKQRLWLSLICSLGASMLLFAMVPMITPLDANIVNVILCLAGGALFSVGLGFVSKVILDKTSLV